jgi:Fe(3+) dicitrate transport protein
VLLSPIVVSAARPLHVIGHLDDVERGVIYSGKKTEVIVMDSLHANVAQDIERQILGRIPGATFSETEAAGFPSNGVGFRGLNPTQSVEMNTRQDGVNIAADLYGYPETYYAPPSEALDRIEVVEGAGALAFGPQFGGMINYVLKQGAPDTKPLLTTGETGGSFGTVNAFNSVGGGSGAWTYYGFIHYRSEDGWRPNSDFWQLTGYGSLTLRASERLTLRLEQTLLRNRIHMPGGLSDSAFAANPQQSFRARNWLASPWNVTALHLDWKLSPQAGLQTAVSYLAADRHLVWRNEDGGPAAMDTIDPATGTYVPREVERETFHDWTLESRLRLDHAVLGRRATLATGIRAGLNDMHRFEDGPGSTGSDFNMNLYGGTWGRALRFGTANLAAFAEELIRVTDRLSVTPGVRYEYLRSTASGYTEVDSTFAPRRFAYPLLGLAAQYVTGPSTALYANVTEAYRPILYAALTPFGSMTRVDPRLGASRGYNADLGWRGTIQDLLKLDVGVFYLWYGDRVGTRTVTDSAGETFAETANIGNSIHKGIEAYLELDPFPLLGLPRSLGNLDLFTSFAYVDARYVSGEFAGNRVEQAPRVVDRTGVTYATGPIATTLQVSHTSASFGDANNTVTPTDDAEAGLVPAYTVWDWSGSLDIGARYALTMGVNNLANARYFTKRTGEYPGPGILPGIGRSVYLGLRAKL